MDNDDYCNIHKPTELTVDQIDNVIKYLMNYEIKHSQCFKCGKKHFGSYGYNKNECDECWFSRFPKEDVEKFCKTFF